jgi:hypothetical protein
MSQLRYSKAGFILSLIALVLLGGAVVTTALLWWLGDWEAHNFGLKLSLRIVWGCWFLTGLATVLTRVTIFGWSFRRYFRWPAEGAGTEPAPRPANRPARAPWYKSGTESFFITVFLVSLTGVIVLATAVMWILVDVTGERAFWLVFKILWPSWWVLVMATVVTRVAIFGSRMRKATTPGKAPASTDSQEKPPAG